MDYMDIPESVVSNNDFDAFRKSYYTYAENPDIENAYTFLEEASNIYDMPGVTQHTFDPIATMNTAMEADYNARVNGMLDEAYAVGKSGMSARELAQSKGVPSTLTDADAAGMTMKMDEDGSGGYNGGNERVDAFKPTSELENHIKFVDQSVPRSRGIGGAHNSEEFFKNDIKIVKTIPSKDMPGVTYYEYTMPLLGKDGKSVGGYGQTIFYKTVYDPKILSHSEYMRRGLEAANYSYRINNGVLGEYWEGYDSYGIRWIGFEENGLPKSFYPYIPKLLGGEK